MKKEIISDWQALSILILFLASTSTVLMVALSAEGDYWLAIILSVSLALFMALIIIQLHTIFPGKNLFDICEACFGKIIGRIICILYILFVFEEGTMVLINAKQFITATTIAETPQTITIIPIMVLCAFAVKVGIEVIGKWSKGTVILLIAFILIMVMLLVNKMDINNFEPVLHKGFTPVFEGALSAFAFPFGEIVMLSLVFSNFKTKKSAYKVYIIGLLISGALSLMVATATVLVLGFDIATTSYFPVYTAARVINIGNFIQRLEVLVTLISVLGAFLKNSIILLATCKGIVKVLNLSNYRFITIPVSLLMVNLSNIWFDSRMAFVNYNADVWPYYAIVFEVFIPIMLLITAVIKQKRFKDIKI